MDTAYGCQKCSIIFPSVSDSIRHDLINHVMHPPMSKVKQTGNGTEKRVAETVSNTKVDEKILYDVQPHEYVATIIKQYHISQNEINVIIQKVVSDLQSLLSRGFCIFGSGFTGLCLKGSDLDILCKNEPSRESSHYYRQNYSHRNNYNHRGNGHQGNNNADVLTLRKMTGILRRSNKFRNVFGIFHCRVPIIKCIHEETNMHLDISISKTEGVDNSLFIRDILTVLPKLKELILLIKIWYARLNLKAANFPCYSLIMMILFYLQKPISTENGPIQLFPPIKEFQKSCRPYWVSWANCGYDLSSLQMWPDDIQVLDLLIGFFQFYNDIDFEAVIISPFLGKLIQKTDAEDGLNFEEYNRVIKKVNQQLPFKEDLCLQTISYICVQDPFFLNRNMTKIINRENYLTIKKAFENANNIILNSISSPLQFYTTLYFSNVGLKLRRRKDREMTIYVKPSSKDYKKFQNHKKDFFFYWASQFLKMVERVLICVFECEVIKITKGDIEQILKRSKINDTESEAIIWNFITRIDVWSNRCFKKIPNLNFIDAQIRQTRQMKLDRAKIRTYQTCLRGTLEIRTNYQHHNIQIEVKSNQSPVVTKNFMKFFNIFKSATSCISLSAHLEEGKPSTPVIRPRPWLLPTPPAFIANSSSETEDDVSME